MDTVNEETTVNPVKTFLVRHKTKIAVAATAVTCLAVNRLSHASKDEFLKEHDLYDEYYTVTDEE